MIRKLDHVGIAVDNLDEGIRFWRDGLGLKLGGTETVETEKVRVAFLPVGESRLELLEPTSDDSPIKGFIDRRGPGINHLTLAVEDIEKVLERLKQNGTIVLGKAPRNGAGGTRVAFLHPKSCGGVLVELVERPEGQDRQASDIRENSVVLAYLREPQEKLWGILRRLDAYGMVLEAIDLGSFDDWMAQVEKEEESVIGPSVLFVPMSRVEKLLLDRPSGSLPSMTDRFVHRTGKTVREVLG